MGQQGIYAATNTNRANSEREEIKDIPKLWVIDFEINGMEGMAVVKANNPKRAEEILVSESQYNAYRGSFKIIKIEEILESPDEMLLMENIL